MRVNLPVSGQEYEFEAGRTLVSATDLDSRITYCNAAFVAVSGYEASELIGQPHNLIRHPDMPREAYRDMWATLREGRPWTQLVKNRRKNGDHYWVLANVTPVVESGRAVGYMSVRTKPTRTQVQDAEALYARMRAESDTGRISTHLHRGRIEKGGLLAGLARRLRFGVTGRIVAALTVFGLLDVAIDALLAGSGPVVRGAGYAVQLLSLLTLAWWLHGSITLPMRRAVELGHRMASGDLASLRSGRTDELGDLLGALNQVSMNLRALVNDVRSQSAQLDASAEEISSATLDLSSRTEVQAGNLQQTACAIEQIASTVQQNAGSAAEASRQAGGTGRVAEQASEAVGQVQERMQAIEAASQRIATINSVIDGIAFQTNILALNAAVEAARAGEQGRGFAVVAGEVRSLAQRSADAARQIKALIEESREAVEGGSRLAHGAGGTMREVVASARQLGVLIEGISVASTQQSAGVVQVNAAVAQLDSATQQNAAMAEQSNAAVGRLKQQADALTRAVAMFRG